ncbi:MAG: aspartate carbamoyltransferase [Alphaproteobacteria bacterium]|nr:aspartate carbamoyltransferase [Alphaproteobacteria bacterium]
MALRHLTSINDLTNEEIERIFLLAEDFLEDLGDRDLPARIGRSVDACAGAVMATVFYEPSTRTRLSFESAMCRLGGKVISSADPAASSTAKGETLADTARIVSAYADVIVLRHPLEGAARLAAQYSTVPVINGGDGAHEHPTQALCDLFTIQREKGALQNLNVALFGDLKNSRTIHSLAYALARFGANLLLMPAPGMELPGSVEHRLHGEFDYAPLNLGGNLPDGVTKVYGLNDAVVNSAIDVLYLTRFQKERWTDTKRHYPVVNRELVAAPCFRQSLVMHALPRAGELDPAFDSDPRAAYFRQASYGVPIRMALISLLLNHGAGGSLERFVGGFRATARSTLHKSGTLCSNFNCISHVEGRVHRERLAIKPERPRCLYCDHEILQSPGE